jgi:hypothetical protein
MTITFFFCILSYFSTNEKRKNAAALLPHGLYDYPSKNVAESAEIS